MRFEFIRGTILNVHLASIRIPTPTWRKPRRKMRVRVSDSPVVFDLELVERRSGRGITARPKLLDESIALFIGSQIQEGCALFIRDDVNHVLFKPESVFLLLNRNDT